MHTSVALLRQRDSRLPGGSLVAWPRHTSSRSLGGALEARRHPLILARPVERGHSESVEEPHIRRGRRSNNARRRRRGRGEGGGRRGVGGRGRGKRRLLPSARPQLHRECTRGFGPDSAWLLLHGLRDSGVAHPSDHRQDVRGSRFVFGIRLHLLRPHLQAQVGHPGAVRVEQPSGR